MTNEQRFNQIKNDFIEIAPSLEPSLAKVEFDADALTRWRGIFNVLSEEVPTWHTKFTQLQHMYIDEMTKDFIAELGG